MLSCSTVRRPARSSTPRCSSCRAAAKSHSWSRSNCTADTSIHTRTRSLPSLPTAAPKTCLKNHILRVTRLYTAFWECLRLICRISKICEAGQREEVLSMLAWRWGGLKNKAFFLASSLIIRSGQFIDSLNASCNDARVMLQEVLLHLPAMSIREPLNAKCRTLKAYIT